MQTISAFGRVQDALSYFVESYDTIANLAAVVNRLAGFTEHIDEAAEVKDDIKRDNNSSDKLSVENLTIKLPNSKILINNLTFDLEQSKRLLVTGASGCGKSTLLRTLAGIWFYAEGRIALPEGAKVLFLPQKPYLPLGTLRRALEYPSTETQSKEKLSEVLKTVELDELTDKLEVVDDWSRILSLGEQQRLAFARVLLSKPKFLFLDEATSALDEPREREMYQMLREKLPQLTIVSVGHRSTLKAEHDVVLSINNKTGEILSK